MKQTLIGILLLGIAGFAHAQDFHKLDTARLLQKLNDRYKELQSPYNNGQPRLYHLPADSILKRYRQQEGQVNPGVTATFSHNTASGKVYTLTPDNMPCLVPYSSSKMPVKGQGPYIDKWMNPGNLQPIIPPADAGKEKGKK